MPFGPWPGGGGGAGFPVSGSLLTSRMFYADQLGIPTAGHPITALAPSDLDILYPDLSIAAYAEETQQGRTFKDRSPDAGQYVLDASSLVIEIVAKAASTPPGPEVIQWGLYYRNISDDAALPAWTGITLADMPITDDDLHYFGQTLVIGGGGGEINITPGSHVEFELVREMSEGANLTGNANLYSVSLFWHA